MKYNWKEILNEKIVEFINSEEFLKFPTLNDKQKGIVRMVINENLSKHEISLLIKKHHMSVENTFIRCLNIIWMFIQDKKPYMLIENSALSTRTKNIFDNNTELEDLIYIKDLDGYSASKLLKVRNMGKKCLNEIKEYLKDFGFSLSD
jgi:DNA-directed RNA polymerase alpha subunit